MAKCPNCGLSTVRTKDWACQWCGYPLVSGLYTKTSKTLDELRNERLGETAGTALLVESEADVSAETELVQGNGAGLVPESEQVQDASSSITVAEPAKEEHDNAEPAVKQQPEPEAELTDEQEAEPEAITEQVPEPELSNEQKSETVVEQQPAEEQEIAGKTDTVKEAVPEAVVEQETILSEEGSEIADAGAEQVPEQVSEVTVRELCELYQGYGMAGHDEFKDRVFKVKGLLGGKMIKEVVGQYRIAMTDKNPHPLGDVYCKFEQKDVPTLNNLKVGQELTVQGKYDGFVTNIVLKNCVLVE